MRDHCRMRNTMKNEKQKIDYTVKTVPAANQKVVETATKSLPLTHIYTTAHFTHLVHAFQ